jgi:nucleotide-binding universal stress UspA family protein
MRTVLCPVDFSDQSRQALRWAAALATRHGCRLMVINVVDPLLAEAAKAKLGYDLVGTETEPALHELALASLPDENARPETVVDVRVGDPSTAILDIAAKEDPELIVMGTHGLGGVRKWIVGSTTERVLRHAPSPVFAVPPDAAPADPARLLAGTDFSEPAAEAVRWAGEFARERGIPLILMHVVEPIAVPSQWRTYLDEADEARVAEARLRLHKLSTAVPERVECEPIVTLGRPADALAAAAAERGAGLIVVGLSGGHGPLAPRPGSIAYRTLCLARVPVVVVPPRAASGDARA